MSNVITSLAILLQCAAALSVVAEIVLTFRLSAKYATLFTRPGPADSVGTWPTAAGPARQDLTSTAVFRVAGDGRTVWFRTRWPLRRGYQAVATGRLVLDGRGGGVVAWHPVPLFFWPFLCALSAVAAAWFALVEGDSWGWLLVPAAPLFLAIPAGIVWWNAKRLVVERILPELSEALTNRVGSA